MWADEIDLDPDAEERGKSFFWINHLVASSTLALGSDCEWKKRKKCCKKYKKENRCKDCPKR